MSQTSIYRARITTVQQWLRELHHIPLRGTVDYAELIDRAVAEWYPGRGAEGRERAAVALDKAARLLRGEQVQTAGGRPRKWRRVPVIP